MGITPLLSARAMFRYVFDMPQMRYNTSPVSLYSMNVSHELLDVIERFEVPSATHGGKRIPR